MKVLLLEEFKKAKYTDFPDPKIEDPHDMLVRIKAAAFCGTDIHDFDGSQGKMKPPIIMGHEAAGEVVEIGSAVTSFKKGDRITFDSQIYCGECFYCQNGMTSLCDNLKVYGHTGVNYHQHGTFAEYVVVPDRIAFSLPEGLSYEEAACIEPLAVAAHSVRLTPLALNDTVAVVGTGPIGNLVIQVLKTSMSGKIIALDTDPIRRDVAKSSGADMVFDPADSNLDKNIKELTRGRGVDRVIDAVGVTASIKTSVSIVRKGGSITSVGNNPLVEFPLKMVVGKQICLQGSAAISGEYPIVIDLMARKKVNVKALISATAPLSEGEAWINKLYNREGNYIKVVLIP